MNRKIGFLAGILIVTVLLAGCTYSDNKNNGSQTETQPVFFQPIQCQQNPWEKAFTGQGIPIPIEKTEEFLVKAYYQQLGIPIFEYTVIPPKQGEVFCTACNCPRGDVLKVTVSESNASRMVEFGWRTENNFTGGTMKKESLCSFQGSETFYYFVDQKIPVLVSTSDFTIQFRNAVSEQELRSGIESIVTEKFSVTIVAGDENRYWIRLEKCLTKGALNALIEELNRQPIVEAANKTVFDENNSQAFLTQRFMVSLKDSSQQQKLEELNQKNNVVIESNYLDGRIILLKIDTKKQSKDALALSQEYFETGLFETSSPEFLGPEQ